MSDFIPYALLDQKQKSCVNSDKSEDRLYAAENGWGLDKLIIDNVPSVRVEVARQGFGIHALVKDAHDDVSNAAWRYLGSHDYSSLLDWSSQNPDMRVFISGDLKSFTPYAELEPKYKRAVDSTDYFDKIYPIRRGFGLDRLVHDKDEFVRKEVAQQGYGLDKLKGDPSYLVWDKVTGYLAKRNLTLDEWIEKYPDRCALPENQQPRQTFTPYDKLTVEAKALVDSTATGERVQAAIEGYGLDKLIEDSSPRVRMQIVSHGYGLDKLINDENEGIKCAVESYLLLDNNQTIEQWIAANPDKCALPENQSIAAEQKLLNSIEKGVNTSEQNQGLDTHTSSKQEQKTFSMNDTFRKFFDSKGVKLNKDHTISAVSAKARSRAAQQNANKQPSQTQKHGKSR